MYFFLDPIVVSLPIVKTEFSEEDQESVLAFVEDLNGWAQHLENHTFYISERCKKELYNPEVTEYPPNYQILEQYWKKYNIGDFYSLTEIYQACQKLLDIDTLTTIESLAIQEEDPFFETEQVTIKPDTIFQKHHEKMREALLNTFGSLTYFQNIEHHKQIFERLYLATKEISDEAINVDCVIYMLKADGNDNTTSYEASFIPVTKPDNVGVLLTRRQKIKRNIMVLVIGGHQNFHGKLRILEKECEIDLRCINPDEDARINDFKRMLSNADCVIQVTSYSSHKLKQIVDDAKELKIPVGSCNSQNVAIFEETLGNLSKQIVK